MTFVRRDIHAKQSIWEHRRIVIAFNLYISVICTIFLACQKSSTSAKTDPTGPDDVPSVVTVGDQPISGNRAIPGDATIVSEVDSIDDDASAEVAKNQEISFVQSTIETSSSTVESGGNLLVTLTLKDTKGRIITDSDATIEFTFTGGTSTVSFGDLVESKPGTFTATMTGVIAGSPTSIGAMINNELLISTRPIVTVIPGSLAEIQFTNVPSVGLTGYRLYPQPTIVLRDSNGNIRANDTSIVVLSVASEGSGGDLIGTTTLAATDGVADFTGRGVGFDTSGSAQKLRATVGMFTADSSTINVFAPTLTIANAGTPLRVAYSDLSSPLSAPSDTPAPASDMALNTDAAILTAGIASTAALTSVNAATGSGVSSTDLTDQTKSWNIMVTRNNSVSTYCYVLAPLSSISCDFSGPFTVNYEHLKNASLTNSNLQIDDTWITSNTLPLNKFSVTQLTNFRNGFSDLAITAVTPNASSNYIFASPQLAPYLTVFNNSLYFAGNKSDGNSRLFQMTVDASKNPTFQVVSNTRGNDSADNPLHLTVAGSEMFFAAANASGVGKLHKIDTNNNVTLISNTIANAAVTDDPSQIFLFNSYVYFRSYKSASTYKLFQYRPADNANRQITNIRTATDNIFSPVVLGSNAYFASTNASGGFTKLYRLTNTGDLSAVSNIRGNSSQSDGVQNLIPWNGNVYFIAGTSTGDTTQKIWRFDGTNVRLVTNIRGSLTSTDAPSFMTEFNNKLYFSAISVASSVTATAELDRKLFAIDTDNNVTQVSNIVNNNSDDPAYLSTWDYNEDGTADYLVFAARKANSSARKLFIMDTNENIEQVSDIIPAGDDNPGPGVSFMGDYYFPAQANINSNIKLMRLRRH